MSEDPARKALNSIVDALQPLSSADRKRAVLGALHFLEEDWAALPRNQDGTLPGHTEQVSEIDGGFPLAAKTWMKKNSVTAEEVESVFSFDHGKVNIIADVPGRGKREKSMAIYTLVGLGTFLQTGERTFQDDAAREVCNTHSAYDQANHAATMRAMKSELTGDKKNGWTITMPGLKKAAAIVKKLAGGE